MINFCILSGRVCTAPEVEFEGKEAFTSFDLDIWVHGTSRVKITCLGALAPAAAKYLHTGDRLVVIGWIRYLGDSDSSNEGQVMRLQAIDLALVRKDGDTLW
jgi:single-stranded DNA-binding protein